MLPAQAGVIPIKTSEIIKTSDAPRAGGGDPIKRQRLCAKIIMLPAQAGVIPSIH